MVFLLKGRGWTSSPLCPEDPDQSIGHPGLTATALCLAGPRHQVLLPLGGLLVKPALGTAPPPPAPV